MSEDQYWDYLVVGGDLHGQSYRAPAHLAVLNVPLPEKRLAKFYGASAAAKVIEPITVGMNVSKFPYEGEEYAIASNETNLDQFDIETLIIVTGVSPV